MYALSAPCNLLFLLVALWYSTPWHSGDATQTEKPVHLNWMDLLKKLTKDPLGPALAAHVLTPSQLDDPSCVPMHAVCASTSTSTEFSAHADSPGHELLSSFTFPTIPNKPRHVAALPPDLQCAFAPLPDVPSLLAAAKGTPGGLQWPLGCSKYACASPGGGLLLASFAMNEASLSDGLPVSQMLSMWLSQHDVVNAIHVRSLLCRLVVSGLIITPIFQSAVCALAKRTGAAASVERRRREPARVISPE